jgi:hypothetical protein
MRIPIDLQECIRFVRLSGNGVQGVGRIHGSIAGVSERWNGPKLKGEDDWNARLVSSMLMNKSIFDLLSIYLSVLEIIGR